MNIADILPLAQSIRQQISKVVVGQTETVDLLLTTLFARGHLLLEGPPGTAKTLLARSFSAALSLDFNRIQFTPDLMPGDVIGSNIFDFQSSTFKLTKGPIFTELLLADEINRTPPKTQAALLEVMQERAVTLDGETHGLSDHFMVVATENPIEQQGTYPLPEAQLDRFLFKHILGYPSREEEINVVASHGAHGEAGSAELGEVERVADAATLGEAMRAVAGVRIAEENIAYGVDLIRATREAPAFSMGASPRAAAMLSTAARARAALDGRDYVIPDDLKFLALPALRHRVLLSPTAEIEGRSVDEALSQAIDSVEAPR